MLSPLSPVISTAPTTALDVSAAGTQQVSIGKIPAVSVPSAIAVPNTPAYGQQQRQAQGHAARPQAEGASLSATLALPLLDGEGEGLSLRPSAAFLAQLYGQGGASSRFGAEAPLQGIELIERFSRTKYMPSGAAMPATRSKPAEALEQFRAAQAQQAHQEQSAPRAARFEAAPRVAEAAPPVEAKPRLRATKSEIRVEVSPSQFQPARQESEAVSQHDMGKSGEMPHFLRGLSSYAATAFRNAEHLETGAPEVSVTL